MYEYKDSHGERVTVRSTRTLERLLESGNIVGTTPFRLPHEPDFIAAAVHPAAVSIAQGRGISLEPPPGVRAATAAPLPSEPSSVPVTQNEVPTAVPAPPVRSVPSANPSLWVLRPPSNRAAKSQEAKPARVLQHPLVAGIRMSTATVQIGGALKDALMWQALALFVGLISYGVALIFGAGSLAPLLALLAIVLSARHGARCIVGRSATVPAAAKWIGAIGGGLLAMLTVGPFGILAAGAAVVGLNWGAKPRKA